MHKLDKINIKSYFYTHILCVMCICLHTRTCTQRQPHTHTLYYIIIYRQSHNKKTKKNLEM